MCAEDELFFSAHNAIHILRCVRDLAHRRRLDLTDDRARSRKLKGKSLTGILLGQRPPLNPALFTTPRPRFGSTSFQVEWQRFYRVTRGLYLPPQATEEQLELREHIADCARRDRERAGVRAHSLLMDFLDDQQREEYTRFGRFHVVKMGPLEGYEDLPPSKRWWLARADNPRLLRYRRYRLLRGFPAGNVQVVSHQGIPKVTFCLHPPEAYPTDDILLAQKLLIESNEAEAIRQANITHGSGGMGTFGVGVATLVD